MNKYNDFFNKIMVDKIKKLEFLDYGNIILFFEDEFNEKFNTDNGIQIIDKYLKNNPGYFVDIFLIERPYIFTQLLEEPDNKDVFNDAIIKILNRLNKTNSETDQILLSLIIPSEKLNPFATSILGDKTAMKVFNEMVFNFEF